MNELLKIGIAISKVIIRESKSAGMKKELGNLAVDEMTSRLRRGFGSRDGKKVQLPRLKKTTKKRRGEKRLHPDTSADKSNFTETGETIDTIFFRETKRGISVGIGSNRKIAKRIKENPDFPIIGITDQEEAQLVNIVVKRLVKRIINAVCKI